MRTVYAMRANRGGLSGVRWIGTPEDVHRNWIGARGLPAVPIRLDWNGFEMKSRPVVPGFISRTLWELYEAGDRPQRYFAAVMTGRDSGPILLASGMCPTDAPFAILRQNDVECSAGSEFLPLYLSENCTFFEEFSDMIGETIDIYEIRNGGLVYDIARSGDRKFIADYIRDEADNPISGIEHFDSVVCIGKINLPKYENGRLTFGFIGRNGIYDKTFEYVGPFREIHKIENWNIPQDSLLRRSVVEAYVDHVYQGLDWPENVNELEG